jgi:hypothetical protein
MLWAFRTASAIMIAPDVERQRALVTQLSKRAIRSTSNDEMVSFAEWVAHQSLPIGHTYGFVEPVHNIIC